MITQPPIEEMYQDFTKKKREKKKMQKFCGQYERLEWQGRNDQYTEKIKWFIELLFLKKKNVHT